MIHLPQGTVVHISCIYDNTSDNLNNPNDPPQMVVWGNGTNDEMFFVPFRYVFYEEGDENIYLGSENVLLGDVNGDGMINVLDVVQLVNFILSGVDVTPASDVNVDGTLNVLDVIQLVNMILA